MKFQTIHRIGKNSNIAKGERRMALKEETFFLQTVQIPEDSSNINSCL